MTDSESVIAKKNLRRRAEDKVRELEGGASQTISTKAARLTSDPDKMIHELRVHQIELEIQAEELRRLYREAEISRDRYIDLYDFAPVAYFTVGEKGTILEANLTASLLFGVERVDLLRRPLSKLILPEDQDIYYRQRKALVESGEPRSDELRMVKVDGSQFWAHMKAVVTKVEDGATVFRVVVSDISERKKAKEEREELIAELQKALANVKLLGGLIPICASCKKIRNDDGYWQQIESYIRDHSEVEFSHGICPDCGKALYGDLYKEEK